LRILIALLLTCCCTVVGSYFDVQTINFVWGGHGIRCTSPLLLASAVAILLLILKLFRITNTRQRLMIAVLAGAVMLVSYQVFSHRAYLHSVWKTIDTVLKTPDNGYRTWQDRVRGRWQSSFTEATTETEAYEILDQAIADGVGVGGVFGFILYNANAGILGDILLYKWSVDESALYVHFGWHNWLQYIVQARLVFGCLLLASSFEQLWIKLRRRFTNLD
jgi:hypothetical protein